jgi:hypothetical protein
MAVDAQNRASTLCEARGVVSVPRPPEGSKKVSEAGTRKATESVTAML